MSARTRFWVETLALVLGLASLAVGVVQLRASQDGLVVTREQTAGGTPVTVWALREIERAPVVVVAHGFAGSRTLMLPISHTLAQAGYAVVAFDFPGHGSHARTLGGNLGSGRRVESLGEALAEVVEYGRNLSVSDGQLALLGHSMAGDVLVRHAMKVGSIDAIVGLSPYLSEPAELGGLETPLLVAYGSFEPEILAELGRVAVASGLSGISPAELRGGQTYGQGRGRRRLEIIEGAEHIGILFSTKALRNSVDWLDHSTGRVRKETASVYPRRLGLLAYFLGAVLLGLLLAGRLPRAAEKRGAGFRGRRLFLSALVPAVATPVLLAPLPTDFLPSVLADHLALHFLVYGAITALALYQGGVRPHHLVEGLHAQSFMVSWGVIGVYELLALGLAAHVSVATFFPGPNRVAATIILSLGAVLWCVSDEWLTRGTGAPIWAYPFTKALFLGSLLLGVALTPDKLFFIVLIVPAILILFVIFGAFSSVLSRSTGHPLVAAFAHGLLYALVVAATFPVVGG